MSFYFCTMFLSSIFPIFDKEFYNYQLIHLKVLCSINFKPELQENLEVDM